MKRNYNTLKKYILDCSTKDLSEETVNGLFRAILEPIISNQKFEAIVLLKINNPKKMESFIKRLTFLDLKILSFNDELEAYGISNNEADNIWGDTEFVVVLGQRYSAVLMWDNTLTTQEKKTPVCLIYNSKIINEISRTILENSKEDFKNYILKYCPDRRENVILNKSIRNIANILDDKNSEITFKEFENNNSEKDDTVQTSKAIADKAKFIAHEIKNNLSIINLYSKITQKRFESIKTNEETKESVNTAITNIEKASQTISYLINDLRCLSSTYLTEVNLQYIVLSTIALCQEKANQANVEIRTENLLDYQINTDKNKLECALMNIIFNATEAIENNGIINIDTKENENYISITISNNGAPISKENQERIFEQDFTTKPKGNGLGLAICKKQMQEIGGDIKLLKSDETETIFEILIKK